jgi:hypothetical protein
VLSVRPRSLLPPRNVRQHNPRPGYACERSAALGDRLLDYFKTALRLLVDIPTDRGNPIRRYWSRARDCYNGLRPGRRERTRSQLPDATRTKRDDKPPLCSPILPSCSPVPATLKAKANRTPRRAIPAAATASSRTRLTRRLYVSPARRARSQIRSGRTTPLPTVGAA